MDVLERVSEHDARKTIFRAMHRILPTAIDRQERDLPNPRSTTCLIRIDSLAEARRLLKLGNAEQ